MVTFTLGTPGTLNFLAAGAADFISAADIVDGVYYATIYGGTFVTMDTATGVFTTIGGTSDLTGLAWDYHHRNDVWCGLWRQPVHGRPDHGRYHGCGQHRRCADRLCVRQFRVCFMP